MSTKFYLVRHAYKEKGIGDVSISLDGLSQARITANHFRKVPVTKIICSPSIEQSRQLGLLLQQQRKQHQRMTGCVNVLTGETYPDKHFRSLWKCGTDARRSESLLLQLEIQRETLVSGWHHAC